MVDIAKALSAAKRLRELAGKATRGDWAIEDPVGHCLTIVQAGKQPYEWAFIAECPWPDEDEHLITSREVKANAAFIAAARNDTPALCEAVEELAKENERLRAELAKADLSADRSYVAGARAGYNLGVVEDQEGLAAIRRNRMCCTTPSTDTDAEELRKGEG